jgi:hypothetical protein
MWTRLEGYVDANLRRRRPTMKLKFITCFFGILEL